MTARVVRAHYDDLAKVATTFDQHVDLTRQLLEHMRQQQATLEAGDWLGLGARAFYAEMNAQVVPSMNRLIRALEQAASTTRQIHTVMHQAEIDAAALFRIDGAAGGATAASEATAAAGGAGSNGGPQVVQSGPGTAPGTTTVSGGTPFARGAGDTDDISPNDVTQGQLGDCGLMASLAAIAQANPDVIRNMIKDNGDGSYTVTFKINVGDRLETITAKHIADYNKEHGIPDWMMNPYGRNPMAGTVLIKEIRVTPDFPANGSGQPVYAQYGDSAGGKPEIWVPLIEKAYAQMRGDYSDMNGINPYNALSNITGKPSMIFSPDETSIEELADFQAKGNAIVMDTPNYTTQMAMIGQAMGKYSIVPNHAYFVTNVDKTAGTVSLRNPWGWTNKELTMSYPEFNAIFTKGAINPTR